MAKEKQGNVFFSFFGNLVTSGKSGNSDESIRYTILNIVVLTGGIFLLIFGTMVFIEGNISRAISDVIMSVLCFTAFVLLRTKLPLQVPGGIVIGAFGILCAMFVSTGELHGFASLWIFIVPLVSIFVLGLQIGLVYSILLLCAVVTFTLVPGIAGSSYNMDSATRIIGVYILVTLFTVIYEQTRIVKDRRVTRLNHELRVERDIIAAMKDNLKLGLFMMNSDFVIQGAYSKLLENILGTNEIEGRRFTDLLDSSLKPKERITLEDYLKMVLNRQYEASMLEDINPISEFTYVDNINQKTKILRTGFSVVDQGLNTFNVLGSIEDVTIAKELERQLIAEANKREEEMKDLYQVIHVDPAVFSDFIDDTEYEFDLINKVLKDKDISAKEAMVNVYQSVHAIKSNALILGLENFSGKLHELENTIKKFRDEDEVTFENVLHITVELEKIMKEKDKFRDIIGKIESFMTTAGGNNRRQDRHVLLETLSKACEKAAQDYKKSVAFTVDELDGSILEHGPRRVIKEVLTQLVRNSVSHGIEMPEERKNSGKDSQGNIRLSITKDKGNIHLKLSDDGGGLDFDKIRKRALEQELISKEEADDVNKLLKVIFSPGFSTANAADFHAGRGIGLNLVRERIKELNGSVNISSKPGKGTTFNLFIPLTDEAADSKAS